MIKMAEIFKAANNSKKRTVNRKHSGFHLIQNYPGIPVYATNFRIIPFFFMEIFFPKNGNPSSITLGIFICMKMLINLNA